MTRAVLLAAVVGAAGCADADTSPAVRCEQACARDQRCARASASPYCRADCAERSEGLLPEYFTAYMECYAALDCDLAEAICESEAGAGLERRAIDDNFLAACQAKHRECDELFNSAFCFQSHYYAQEWIERAITCLSMTCDAVEFCLAREMPFAPFGR